MIDVHQFIWLSKPRWYLSPTKAWAEIKITIDKIKDHALILGLVEAWTVQRYLCFNWPMSRFIASFATHIYCWENYYNSIWKTPPSYKSYVLKCACGWTFCSDPVLFIGFCEQARGFRLPPESNTKILLQLWILLFHFQLFEDVWWSNFGCKL